MSFTERQVRALGRSVAPRHVRSRVRDGRELDLRRGLVRHLRGKSHLWLRWLGSRDPRGQVRSQPRDAGCLPRRLQGEGAADGANSRPQHRSEGYGTGEGRSGSLGEAHDVALKAAETDATKRALVTFGKAFGLALYANRNSGTEQRPAEAAATAEQPALMPIDAPPASPNEGDPITESGRWRLTRRTRRIGPKRLRRRSSHGLRQGLPAVICTRCL